MKGARWFTAAGRSRGWMGELDAWK
jgi:hypothetical protein